MHVKKLAKRTNQNKLILVYPKSYSPTKWKLQNEITKIIYFKETNYIFINNSVTQKYGDETYNTIENKNYKFCSLKSTKHQ
jgi:hypothetical protein